MKASIPKKVVFLGLVWPEPSTTAAGIRIMQLIHCFLEENYQVTFASTATKTAFSEDLSVHGVHSQQIRLNDPSFDTFIAELAPNIVVFDRFITEEQFGWRIAKNAPIALQILDTEDLHSLRKSREKALKAKVNFSIDTWKQSDLFLREIASIYRCDCSLLISSYEIRLLQSELQIKEELLYYLPFLIPPIIDINELGESFEKRAHFICIGNGKHAPNIDAIQYLKKTIWPLIRKNLPTAQMHIYGTYLPQAIEEMHEPVDGFEIKGRAEDIAEVMENARVSLAPLRFGAGIKGKLVASMEYGTPNVTTTIGAEGMDIGGLWNGSITDDPEKFAEEAIRLYTQKEQWLVAQQHGIRIINSSFNKDTFSSEFLNRINILQESLEKHRVQNHIGAILKHHTMNSTKYMSKWIEAKNKQL